MAARAVVVAAAAAAAAVVAAAAAASTTSTTYHYQHKHHKHRRPQYPIKLAETAGAEAAADGDGAAKADAYRYEACEPNGTPPPYDNATYYADAYAAQSAEELRAALARITAKNYQRYSYSCVWDMAGEADEDPDNPNNVILFYTGQSWPKVRPEPALLVRCRWAGALTCAPRARRSTSVHIGRARQRQQRRGLEPRAHLAQVARLPERGRRAAHRRPPSHRVRQVGQQPPLGQGL